MAIKDGIRTLLLGQSSITSLCPAQSVAKSNLNAGFVNTVEQGVVPPYIKIKRTAYDNQNTLDGSVGTGKSTIEISSFSSTEPGADALAKAVSDFFKNYSGAAGNDDTIVSVDWDDAADETSAENIGNGQFRYSVKQVYTVWHR